MRKFLLAACTAVLFASPVGAQTAPRTLTLEQAIARVTSVGFDLRMARADAVIASADARSAQSLLRPQIGVSANALDANEPQLGMPIARQAYGAASLSVPLFAPSNGANARAARETALAAISGIAATANDAILATVAAYRRVQLAEAVLATRRVAVTDQARHLRVTEQRVAAGKAARYLTLRDRAAFAAATQAEEDASSERDQATNDLQALLDLGQEPLVVEPLTQVRFSESRDALLARALRSRPSLVAAEQRVAATESGVAAARAAYSPTATLTAQSYNGTSSPALGRSGGQIQVTASLPIVDGGTRSAATSRARAQYDRALAARDQIRVSVIRDVANAWREYEAATRNLSTATAAVADAQEQLRLAELRENAGKAIDVEVLDALSVAAMARESTARSLARYDLSVAAIFHATGDASQ
ncbi:MAG: hypothetical protein NVS2B17_23370 [Candidatus Velthaea sp.]